MKIIDLHVHSNASDGTFTPKEVVQMALKKGLSAIALTDHDTVRGVQEALNTAIEHSADKDSPMEVIPGIELSALYAGKEIHILGYFIDHTDDRLSIELEKIIKERENRNLTMVKRLASEGIDITMDKLQDGNPDTVITRAHFSKVLLDGGYVKTTKDAFDKYLGCHTPYYVPRKYLTPEDSISLIQGAGGCAVLAHPLLYKFSDSELDQLTQQLKQWGLVGIEAIYSSNHGYHEEKMKHLAKRHELLITGGTDFHGANKPDLDIGTGRGNMRIPHFLLDELRKVNF